MLQDLTQKLAESVAEVMGLKASLAAKEAAQAQVSFVSHAWFAHRRAHHSSWVYKVTLIRVSFCWPRLG